MWPNTVCYTKETLVEFEHCYLKYVKSRYCILSFRATPFVENKNFKLSKFWINSIQITLEESFISGHKVRIIKNLAHNNHLKCFNRMLHTYNKPRSFVELCPEIWSFRILYHLLPFVSNQTVVFWRTLMSSILLCVWFCRLNLDIYKSISHKPILIHMYTICD